MHLTDPHLFADSASSLRGTVTHSSLKNVLAHVSEAAWPADLVSVTGDIVQDDSSRAYERFRDLMSPLGLPVHCVPGNHDVRSFMQEALSSPPFHYCESLTIGNWCVVGIDSCLEGSAAGRIDDSELSRLESLLQTTAADHVMICLHHPPLPVGSKWLDSVGLRNADDFLQLLSRFSCVRLAIFGHVHQPFDDIHGNVRIIGTPSTCRQFAAGSVDFAVDDNPPAYRRLSLFPDGRIEEDLLTVPGMRNNV